MTFKNFRQFALAALVLVGGSAAAFADANLATYDTIIDFSQTSSTARDITIVSGANKSSTGGGGSEISVTGLAVSVNYDGSWGPGAPYTDTTLTSGFLTFDFKSTGAASGTTGAITQAFTGSFALTDGAGKTYVAGSNVALTFGTTVGTKTTAQTTTVSALTGTLIDNGQYKSPFGLDLNFFRQLSNTTVVSAGGVNTLGNNSLSLNGSDISGQQVPEPSTFALLGLGAAGLAVSAYRRRKAAAAV